MIRVKENATTVLASSSDRSGNRTAIVMRRNGSILFTGTQGSTGMNKARSREGRWQRGAVEGSLSADIIAAIAGLETLYAGLA